MTAVRVRPGPVHGTTRAPPSKSYTHRALVVGHLARRTFRVRRPLDSDDTRATAAALEQLGTSVRRGKGSWQLAPKPQASSEGRVLLQCRESGTTLRFVCALAALSDRPVQIAGEGRLSERPVDALLDALKELGASCRHVGGSGLPIEICGPIHGGRLTLEASESSQFASALLLVLPTLEDDSSLELTGTIVSEPYLEATLAVLRHEGIRVERRGRRFRIPGRQRPRGSGFTVPGDASSAAYLWTAAAVGGGTVRVHGVDPKWPQADLMMLDLLQLAGAAVSRGADGARVSRSRPKPFRVDLTNAPDLYPLAGVLAATIPAVSRITGAEHVVHKESDRRAETVRLARRLGARVERTPSGLRILGTDRPRALHVPDLSDHRLVMSAAVGALAADGDSLIGRREAVRKSYPGFWSAFRALSGGVRGP
jgi:3-phosphoshikimate 1-carboxyvinyltransferase